MKRFMLAFASLMFASVSLAADNNEYVVVIKNHLFHPAEVVIPAGQKVKLIIDNQDPTPEEFESHTLNREKIIPGNSRGFVMVGPLKPGKYNFFGEFHEKTAQGFLVVK